MRLIDAEGSELQTQLKIIREAEYQIYGRGSWGFTAKCEHAIEDAPTIQPKRGKWIVKDDTERFIAQCNCCRYIDDSRRIKNYCPNCGAKMEVTE